MKCISNAGFAARVLLFLAIMAAIPPPATYAQDGFQLRFNVDRNPTGPIRMSGTVTNGNRFDALDVYVTAEAVDASDQVIGRGIAYVGQSLPAHATLPFSINIPASPAAAGFRVNVSSFRPGLGVQAP